MKRHKTREVKVGKLAIGGDNPIVIESMTNIDPYDIVGIVSQINSLAKAGCQFVRITLPDIKAAQLVSEIKSQINIPIMGDIHFDYRIALEAINQGIESIRLNPGNIKQKDKIEEVVKKVKENNILVRVGANAGSLDRIKYKDNNAEALVSSVLEHVEIFEKYNYHNLIVSLKSSDVNTTIEAYEKFSQIRDYPLHIGITEAGTKFSGTIKSSAGIGILLYKGLGDTMRVSLSGNPIDEIFVGYKILQSLGLYDQMIDIISCPTCGRCGIDVESIASQVEKACSGIKKKLKVAIMGCVVNGPGEAKEADIGVAGSNKEVILFKKGEFVKKIRHEDIIPELLDFINTY
jgi:(E)-4-hydroxy-3-methylbut-2-enyl-diphosphate synthase